MDQPIYFENQPEKAGLAPDLRVPVAVSSGEVVRLRWPTDYPVVTQAFGANPELHVERGLPGHEGLDIRAPLNSNVYAGADSVVEKVHENIQDGHPYGRHLSLLHAGGYHSLYGHLANVAVHKGQKVRAGTVLGQAGATGSTGGGHIHLSLMQDGASARGLTHFPNDLIDPTPFLDFNFANPDASAFPWPVGRCLIGVNARPDGSWSEDDLQAVTEAKVEAVKLNMQTSTADIGRLKKGNPVLFLMTCLHLAHRGRAITPNEWVAQVRGAMREHADAGVSYFEIQRAPNLNSEGLGLSWQSGKEFGRWWVDVVSLLKTSFPTIRLGFPGLATGAQVAGQRMDAQVFMDQADEAALTADWIGTNCYWANEQEMRDEQKGATFTLMRRYYPNKMLFITEFGNVNALTHPSSKRQQIANYHETLRQLPGVGAAFSQLA